MFRIFLIIMLFIISACSPVVEDTVTREQNIWQLLRQVKVGYMAEYHGQLLQQELEAGFNSLQKKAPHNYDLKVDLSRKNIDLVGRNLYQAKAIIKLYRVDDGTLLHESQILAQSRYSNSGTDIRKEKSRKSAEERAIQQLSRQVVLDIQNYFLVAIENNDL